MVDKFENHAEGLASPANNAFSVTPHDTNELAFIPRGIYVGGSGDIAVILADDTAAVTFVGVLAGTVLPVRPKIIKATGTTATSIVGLY